MDFNSKKKITANEAKNLDIIFLVDTSVSMSTELAAVKRSCTDFADRIIKEKKNVRLGLIGFDIGGHHSIDQKLNYQIYELSRYTIGIWKLTSPCSFKENIKSLTLGLFGGGGCYLADNDTVDIFPHVVSSFNNHNHSKILVIISDEMGRNDGLKEIIRQLKDANIETYVMGVPGAQGAHESIAQQTGGKFWDIFQNRGAHDFCELLNNAADEIVNSIAKKMREAGLSEEYIESHTTVNEKPSFSFGKKIKPTFTFGRKL